MGAAELGQAQSHVEGRVQTIALGLTGIAALLVAHVTITTRLVLDDYGIILSLGPEYYLAVTALIFGFAALWWSPKAHGSLQFVQFLLLVFALYVLPALLEGGPRPRWSYVYFGWTDFIVRTHTIRPEVITYHNWPGFFILMSALIEMGDLVSQTGMMFAYHFIIPLVWAVPFYLLARNQGWSASVFWTSLWFFTAANWLDQSNYQASSLGFFFLMTLAVLLFQRRTDDLLRERAWALSAVLVGAALIVTHFASALVGMTLLTLVVFTERERRQTDRILWAILMVFFLGWAVYGARNILERESVNVLGALLRLDRSISTNLLERLGGSAAHQLVVRAKLVFAGLTALVALGGFLVTRSRPKWLTRNRMPLLMVLAPLSMVVLPVYLGEDYTRIWMVLLVPMAFFSTGLLRARFGWLALAAFFLAAAPLHLLTHYGSDGYDALRPAEWTAHRTFYRIAPTGLVIGGFPLGFSGHVGQYDLSFWPQVKFANGELHPVGGSGPFDEALREYVAVGRGDRDIFRLFEGRADIIPEMQARVDGSPRYARIYQTLDFVIYSRLLGATR